MAYKRWDKLKQWIADNGTALQFIGWAIGAVVATILFVAPFIKNHFFPSQGQRIAAFYTKETSDNFPPGAIKPLTAICDKNDIATKQETKTANRPADADLIPGNVEPVINDGRQVGFTVTIQNGAGTNMGHPTAVFTLEITCQKSSE